MAHGIYHFLVCSKNVTMWCCFRDTYYTFYSVRDCLWPWEVLQFRHLS